VAQPKTECDALTAARESNRKGIMSQATTTTPATPAGYGALAGFGLYLFIACSYIANAMDRSVFSNLNTYVQKDLNLSLAQSGFITTVFALGFGITGVCAGVLLDRYRRKTVLIVGMGIYSVFTMIIPLSQGFWDITVYRVITGVGEAMQQTAIFTMAGVFFAQRRNLALGGMNAAYGIGSFIGPILGIQIFLAGSSNWRLPLYVFGVIGLVYALLLLFFLPTGFSEFGKDESERSSTRAAATTPWLTRDLVLLAAANVLLGVVNYSYLGLYPTFLKSELHYPPQTAALALSMYGIGAFAGLLSGFLADRLGERRLILAAIGGSIVVGLLMFDVAEAHWQQLALSLLFGVFNSGFLFVNVYALTQRSVQAEHIGKASGVASSAHYIGAGFSGAIFGGIVQAAGWGVGGLVVLVAVPAVAAVCVLFVRPAQREFIAAV
jgi:predicted MFS family arabinose efflux permease